MLNEKIKELRKQKGITQQQLADVLCVEKTNISKWESGAYEPGKMVLSKLAEYFNVSVDYLLGRTDLPKTLQDEVEIKDRFPIPLLGSVVAGIPIEAQENLEGYITTDLSPANEYFALRVHGDSMINVGIKDKSIVIVHKQSCANCGQIVVAMLNGAQTVKKFMMSGDMIYLVAANPNYSPIPISQKDDFVILGVVKEVRISF